MLLAIWHLSVWLTCQPGLSLFYIYASLSGFLINYPDLVLMTLLSLGLLLLSIGAFVFSCHCSLFVTALLCLLCLMPLLVDCDLGAVHIACFDYCCCLSSHWHVLLGFYWYCLICLPVGQFLCNAVLWLCIVGMCPLWLMWVLCIVCCMWYICHLM